MFFATSQTSSYNEITLKYPQAQSLHELNNTKFYEMCAKTFTTWPQPVPFCEYIYCTFMCNLDPTRSSKVQYVCVCTSHNY